MTVAQILWPFDIRNALESDNKGTMVESFAYETALNTRSKPFKCRVEIPNVRTVQVIRRPISLLSIDQSITQGLKVFAIVIFRAHHYRVAGVLAAKLRHSRGFLQHRQNGERGGANGYGDGSGPSLAVSQSLSTQALSDSSSTTSRKLRKLPRLSAHDEAVTLGSLHR